MVVVYVMFWTWRPLLLSRRPVRSRSRLRLGEVVLLPGRGRPIVPSRGRRIVPSRGRRIVCGPRPSVRRPSGRRLIRRGPGTASAGPGPSTTSSSSPAGAAGSASGTGAGPPSLAALAPSAAIPVAPARLLSGWLDVDLFPTLLRTASLASSLGDTGSEGNGDKDRIHNGRLHVGTASTRDSCRRTGGNASS